MPGADEARQELEAAGVLLAAPPEQLAAAPRVVGAARGQPREDPVDHQRAEPVAAFDQFAGEEQRVRYPLGTGAGNQEEVRLRSHQQRFDLLRPGSEAVVQRAEGLEELDHVAQKIEPDDPVEHFFDTAAEHAPAGRGAKTAIGGEPVLPGDFQRPAVEKPDDALGRAEEIQGGPGGRRVEDDLLKLAGREQLEQALYGHVLEDAGQRAGEMAVEAVAENAVARRGVRGVGRDQPVEGGPGVEQARGQPSGCAERYVDLALRRRAADSQSILEAMGRIEGDHQGRTARPGRHHPEGRREGRLADAAAPDDDQQARAGFRKERHAAPSHDAARAATSSGPRPRANSGRVTTAPELGGQAATKRAISRRPS
jgi:hypothetical protein